MLLEICLALLSLIVIIIIFQFCRCNKIENFDNSLLDEIKNIHLKQNLMSLEKFVTQDDISMLEESTLQMLSSIQNIKNKFKKNEVNEEIDETLLTELSETINEEDDDNDMEEEITDDDDYENDDEKDDVVEGFMDRSTHNCHSFK